MAEDIVKQDAKLKRITWKTTQTRLETNLEGFRETLLSDALSKEALPPSAKCSVCNCDLQQCVQCRDCGPCFFVCSKCDMDTTAIPCMIGSYRIGNFFSHYYLLKRLTLSRRVGGGVRRVQTNPLWSSNTKGYNWQHQRGRFLKNRKLNTIILLPGTLYSRVCSIIFFR